MFYLTSFHEIAMKVQHKDKWEAEEFLVTGDEIGDIRLTRLL